MALRRLTARTTAAQSELVAVDVALVRAQSELAAVDVALVRAQRVGGSSLIAAAACYRCLRPPDIPPFEVTFSVS